MLNQFQRMVVMVQNDDEKSEKATMRLDNHYLGTETDGKLTTFKAIGSLLMPSGGRAHGVQYRDDHCRRGSAVQ